MHSRPDSVATIRRPHRPTCDSLRQIALAQSSSPCVNPPVPVASLLTAEPVVTTCRSSVPTRSYVALAQVMAPSDGLSDPSSSQAVQCGPSIHPCIADRPTSAAMAHPRTLGQGFESRDRLPTGSTRDAKNRVPRWPATKQTAQTGSGVSRVPRRSRPAQARRDGQKH